MLKQLYGSAVLLIVVGAAMPDRALSQGLPVDINSGPTLPTAAGTPLDEPICFMKTASGQIINLRSVCEDYSTKLPIANNNSQFQRQRSLDNIRVRSPQTIRSGVGYSEDSNNNDDR